MFQEIKGYRQFKAKGIFINFTKNLLNQKISDA